MTPYRAMALVVVVVLGGCRVDDRPVKETAPAPAPARSCPRLGVPAYLEPAEVDLVVDAGAALVVINPDSGPADHRDPELAAAALHARAVGARVLGYVDTDYGRRPADLVMRDASAYRAWYAVDGVFLDRVTAGARGVAYYRAVTSSLRSHGQVALNPGTRPSRAYLRMADVVVTFEGPWSDYRRLGARHDTSTGDEPGLAARWHLVHSVPAHALGTAVRLAAAHGVAYVEATTEGDAETWNRLPDLTPQLDVIRRCAPPPGGPASAAPSPIARPRSG